MKRWLRVIALVLQFCMLLSVFGGCGGNSEPPETDQSTAGGTEAPSDTSGKQDGTTIPAEDGTTTPAEDDTTSPEDESTTIPKDEDQPMENEGTSNIYIFEDGDNHVTVELCSPNMIRVQYSFDGEDGYRPPDPEYYMVQKEVFGAVKHSYVETDKKVTIRTSAMEVQIDKAPFRAKMYDLDGTLLSKDSIDGAYKNGDTVGIRKIEGSTNAGGIFGFGSGDHGRRDNLNRYSVDFTEFSMSHGRVIAPFFMSSVGYGIFLNTISENTTFFKQGGGFETEGYLDYYFMYGPDFKTILNEYAELTGRMEMYGKWALGFMLSKYGNDNATQAEFLEWIHRLRDDGYPTDCYVFDYGWRGDIAVTKPNHSAGQKWGNQMWSNDKTKFPDVAEMFEEARALGFHVGLHNNAGTPEAGGGDKLFMPEYADTWVQSYMDSVITTGYGDFFWPDEFDVLGSNTAPVFSALSAYEAWKEYTDENRPMFMTRGSYAGQHFATAWSGDTDASESDLSYQIGFAIDTGLIGYWATSCDLGGFKTRPSDDLYTRWVAEFGAWSAMMRTHGHDGREPWTFDETAQQTLKQNLKIRYALYPYLYTSMWQGYSAGVPIMRAMLLEDGSETNPDAWNLNQQYYFGDWFLVAPATKTTTTTVNVWFPPNTTWYNYYTGERYEGGSNGKNVTLVVELDEIPVFVKAGAIVPMGPEVNYADEYPLDPLTLDIYPKGTSSYTLYEDDGVSRKYQTENAYATTSYLCEQVGGKVTLTIGERFVGNPEVFTPVDRSYNLIVHHMGKINGVTLDGVVLMKYTSAAAYEVCESGYYLDGTTLYIKFEDSAKKMVLVIDSNGMVEPAEGGDEEYDPLAGLIKIEAGSLVELEDVTRVGANASIGLPIDTAWKGYTGTGFVKGFKCTGDYVTFDANVLTSGTYDLILRVNCGKKNDATDVADRTGAFYLDGEKYVDLAFTITETWGDSDKNGVWVDYVIEDVTLTAGKHTFRIQVEGANPGHYNLDSLRFAETDNSVNGFAAIEAESATHQNGFVFADGVATAETSGAYLGYVSILADGKQGFKIRLSSTTGGTLTVYETGVGDKILTTVDLPSDGEWQEIAVTCKDTDADPSPIYLSFTALSGSGTIDVTVDWFMFE
ncbi:MAG: DUF4968 domain-containing protein [Clostridia bacterium]|nr:DUF4968 domain-containing protein [Clostridia bacterium]